jgi:hypothetical protein
MYFGMLINELLPAARASENEYKNTAARGKHFPPELLVDIPDTRMNERTKQELSIPTK